MNQDEKQKKGYEQHLLSNQIELLDDPQDKINYKKMVKKVCFICGSICNPEKDFNYYMVRGNCCVPCLARVKRNLEIKIRLNKGQLLCSK